MDISEGFQRRPKFSKDKDIEKTKTTKVFDHTDVRIESTLDITMTNANLITF